MRSALRAILLLGLVSLAPGPARADEASDAFQQGRRLLARQKPREAAAQFRKVLQLRPDYPQAFAHLGDALFQLGRDPEALAAYRTALRSDAPGECYPAFLGCGRVLLARNPARKKDQELRQAVSLFNQAITLEPKAPAPYFYRGIAYHRLRQLGKAIADFDRAIELDPAHAAAYEHRGDVWRDRGDKRKAEADYARARELRRRQRPRGTSP